MNRVVVALAASVLTAGAALASGKDDISAVLKQWNDTDGAKAVATCAEDASVIDDIPPFERHGPTTFVFTQKGNPVKVIAKTTFALHKTAAGWRITAWTWATETIS